MKLELSTKDAKLLTTHLARRLVDLQNELVHTTDRHMRSSLATDVEELESLLGRVRRFVDESRIYA
jgi:hypothetical protein